MPSPSSTPRRLVSAGALAVLVSLVGGGCSKDSGSSGGIGAGGSSASAESPALPEILGEWRLVEYEYPDEGETYAQDPRLWEFDGDATGGRLLIDGEDAGTWAVAAAPSGTFTLEQTFDLYVVTETPGFQPFSYGVASISADTLELQHDVGTESNRIDRFSRVGESGAGGGGQGGGGPGGTLVSEGCEAAEQVAEVQVSAIEPTPTGIEVAAGDTLTFSASGTWCWGVGSDECPDGNGTSGRPFSDELPVAVEDASFGELAGRVGDDAFVLGTCATVTFSTSGELELLMSDREGFYADNSGSLRVTVGRP